jgi:hypothetical protein
LNPERAKVQIKIDGTDVLDGKYIIVDGKNSTELKRFCLDGDLVNGNRFKFVPVSHSDVQDPGSDKNGIVQVTFWPEIQDYLKETSNSICQKYHYQKNQLNNPEFQVGYGNNPLDLLNYISDYRIKGSGERYGSSSISRGATVEGNQSLQKFQYQNFGECGISTIITVKIIPKQESIISSQSVYCTKCGNKIQTTHRFCSQCGVMTVFG